VGSLAIFGGDAWITAPGPHYQWPRITPEVEKAILTQLHSTISIYDRSGIFLEFEERFRATVGRKFALVTNSGTSALFSIFEGLDLRLGDELIVPAYTFYATISPLAQFGVFLRQVDCDHNGNMDPNLVEAQITSRTKAIVITHMWGHPCDTAALKRIATDHGLRLIEDCSHAHGAVQNNQQVGSVGDAAAWSLQGQKNITGGEGGILVTDDIELFERSVLLGQYNKRAKQQVRRETLLFDFTTTGYGLKLRAHPLAIAMANEQLSHLERWIANKQKVARLFYKALEGYPFISLPVIGDSIPGWYAFVFNFDSNRARVPITAFVRALSAEGLVEIDRPNSTGCIAAYPLFTRTHLAIPRLYARPMLLNPESQSRAQRFFDTAIKLPVWCFEDEFTWAERYAGGLRKVCDAIATNAQAFQNIS
jgi:dTDP-4-amino-4,6-dideoxygalactose transaminase